jgi:hypothetical protein
MPIVSPPRLVGSRTVGHLFGIGLYQVYDNLKAGHPLITAGYLGKISNRHTWNLHELISRMFVDGSSIEAIVDRVYSDEPPTVTCEAGGCDRVAETLGLCRVHIRHLFTAWKHAPDSTLVTLQLVAMCQWIAERHAHIILPPGFDPWDPVCMTPGCGNPTNIHGPDGWHGPLCPACSAKFWSNSPDRPHPEWWKKRSVA